MAHTHSIHNTTVANSASRLEKVGFWLSVACAIHCLAMPVLITLLPFIGGSFLADHETEFYVLGSSWLLAGILLYNDYRKHKTILPLSLLAGSVATKLLEVFVLGEASEVYMAPIGGLLIAVAYYFNWKHKAACACEHKH